MKHNMIEWDIEELAYRAMGKTVAQTDDQINNGDIDQAIFDKYEISWETYVKIVKDLIPFTSVVQSSFRGETIQGFVDPVEQRLIVKQVFTQNEDR